MCSINLYEAQAACIITCIRHELALLVMVVAVLIVYWCTAVSSGGGQRCPVGVDSGVQWGWTVLVDQATHCIACPRHSTCMLCV